MLPGRYPLTLRIVPDDASEPAVAATVLVIEAKRCVFLPSIPKFELQPDGSVVATLSLGNCGNVDCQGSIKIRHKDGWHFSVDPPQLTISSGIKGVKATLTLRPPVGKSAHVGDAVTLDISWQGQTLLVEPLKGHIKADFGLPPMVRNALIVGSAVVALLGGLTFWAISNNKRTSSDVQPEPSASVLPTLVAAEGRLRPEPTEVHFRAQRLGTSSPVQVITVTNTGPAPVFVAGTRLIGAHTGDFIRKSDTCGPRTLQSDESCRLEVSFSPIVDGGRSAMLVLARDKGATVASVALTGEAITSVQKSGGLSVDTSIVAFGPQRIRVPSASQSIAIRNDGTEAVDLKAATLTGPNRDDFRLTDNCSRKSLPGRGLCRIDLVFTPGGIGGRSATLTIPSAGGGPVAMTQQGSDAARPIAIALTADDPATPLTVALSGTGTAPVIDLGGSTLEFSNQEVGSTSAQRVMTLTNSGTAPASVVVTGPSGTNAGDFILDNGCPRDLTPDAGCPIKVSFRPTGAGLRRATLTITHDGPGSPATISLTGSGTLPPPPRADLSVRWQDRVDVNTSGSPPPWPWRESIVIRNSGPNTATAVELRIDANVVFDSTSQGSCTGGGSLSDGPSPIPMTCTIGSVAPGGMVRVTVYRSWESSTATVSGNEEDPNPANNKATSLYLGIG